MHEFMRACACWYTKAFLLHLCETDSATHRFVSFILHIINIVSPLKYEWVVHFLKLFKAVLFGILIYFVLL